MLKLPLILAAVLVCIAGDALLKQSQFRLGLYATAGMCMYALDAVLWAKIFSLAKFSTAAVMGSALGIILFVAVGVLVFQEKLRLTDYLGVAMAVGSVILLARFL